MEHTTKMPKIRQYAYIRKKRLVHKQDKRYGIKTKASQHRQHIYKSNQ